MTDSISGATVTSSGWGRMMQWFSVMRLPFTSVAVVPFVVGAVMAHAQGALVSPLAATLGTVAVFLICIGCYFSGEVFDQKEDLETLEHGRNPFSGGSLLVAQGAFPEDRIRLAAGVSFALAGLLGLAILAIHRNFALVGLGCFGLLAAASYSTEPIRLVRRGFGEPLIGVCFGWLPLVTGYATASGRLPDLTMSVIFSLPVAFAIFNVILLNEFPDYKADRDTGKRNLLVRVGLETGGKIYAAVSVLVALALLAVWWTFQRGSITHLLGILPIIALALYLAVEVGPRRAWRSPKRLERLCALTIVLDIACAITVGVLARW